MKIYSVNDPEFKAYGRVVTGLEEACSQILENLPLTPLPEGVGYVPTEPILQRLPAADIFRDHVFGGMKAELGWCNGRNTKLNCLEYHRDSEFNLGTEDFILLLAKIEEIGEDGILDTECVKAFRVPAGVLVEVYATTLHYAPCHTDPGKGFRVLVALPWGTNTERPEMENLTREDSLMTARNKWLLAHPESSEAAGGAVIGLKGVNIDIASSL